MAVFVFRGGVFFCDLAVIPTMFIEEELEKILNDASILKGIVNSLALYTKIVRIYSKCAKPVQRKNRI